MQFGNAVLSAASSAGEISVPRRDRLSKFSRRSSGSKSLTFVEERSSVVS
jgi:hypothetical protein